MVQREVVLSLADRQDFVLPLEQALAHARKQTRRWIELHASEPCAMHTVDGRWPAGAQGEKHSVCAATGWWAGLIWLLYEATGELIWREYAANLGRRVEPCSNDPGCPEVGAISYFGTHRRWYEATARENAPDVVAREMIVNASRSLALRFQAAGGFLAEVSEPGTLSIGMMMNVPLVLYVAIETGDDDLLAIGSRHCATTRRFLVRGDGSTAERAVFDTATGECRSTEARLGSRRDSCWSRGLASAIYGFAAAGRLLNFEPWLQTARNCAGYLAERLSGDPVPPWDFDAPPAARDLRDSTAAAIAAAGLLNLADAGQIIGTEQARQRQYLQETALRILERLCGPDYLVGEGGGRDGVLANGLWDYPGGVGVGESVILGDCLFVEAVIRALELLGPVRR